MRKFDFWKTDGIPGVMVAAAVALFRRSSDIVPGIELESCDRGANASAPGL